MQGAGAVLRELLFEPGPYGGVGAGEVEGVDGSLHVQTRTAHQDGGTPFGQQPVDLGPGEPLVLGDAGGLGDVPDVQEVVRNAVALRESQLRRADVHAPVELHGVGVDHFTTELLGEEHSQVGLSGGGGTDDGDDAGVGAGLLTGTVSQTSGMPRTVEDRRGPESGTDARKSLEEARWRPGGERVRADTASNASLLTDG